MTDQVAGCFSARVAIRRMATLIGGLAMLGQMAVAQTAPPSSGDIAAQCKVEPIEYRGWQAQRISNPWVQLVVVPPNGGRLMQVTFHGHDFLFVNPKLAGKRLPPTEDQWLNYGGDKIWLLPEGDDDEQHWRGNSDLIDAGEFSFRTVSGESGCGLELTGPPDPRTGVQISRTIRLEPDSPHIAFHAVMKNVSGHPLEWSMQSVSQYDTSDPQKRSERNREIWGFTPANPASAYLNRYHVRTGPAENPSASVREDGLFTVHYSHLAAEFWVDSPAGWLAVVDGSSRYAMVERFRYEEQKPYPGKASIIFWTNGPSLRFDGEGAASLATGQEASPFYMEAEINSPLCRLYPGESCDLRTDWYPTRAGQEFQGISDAGTIVAALQARKLGDGKVRLSGNFGVFFPGKLVAHFYNARGSAVVTLPVAEVRPSELVLLNVETAPGGDPVRVSLHLEDEHGLDRGALQEIKILEGAQP
ncbi:MAG: hypothetical protein JST79_09650 [Acidobacteria bacterium]|nr:hypothetical protein [Acidobacteriota bacterium]